MRPPSFIALFKNPDRLEAFSDGVFAIAITLLILEIKVPPVDKFGTPALLVEGLLALWPSYLAFSLSFTTILIAWIGHHMLIQTAQRIGQRLILTNGFFLLSVTFLPFPTALVAEHLTHPSATVAAAFYAGVNIVNNFAFLLLNLATRAAQSEVVPTLEMGIRKSWIGMVWCLGALGVAFWIPLVSLLLVAAMWIWWTQPARPEHPSQIG